MAMTQKKRRENRAMINGYLERYINFATLYNIARSRCIWEGFPETVYPIYAERCRIDEGDVFLFEDKDLGIMCLPGSETGRRDVNNIPYYYHVYGANGYHKLVSAAECVRIRNNVSSTSEIPIILKYATDLTDLDEFMRTNRNLAKKSVLLTCDEEQRQTYMKMIDDQRNNDLLILGTKETDRNSIDVLDLGVQFQGEQIFIVRNRVFNQFLTLEGVENSNTDKKERLIADEVSANSGIIEIMRNSRSIAEEQAIVEAKRKLGLDINFRYASMLPTMVNMPELQIAEKLGTSQNKGQEATSDEIV